MNAFRPRPGDPLDRKYLRNCAVYKLLKLRKIGEARALELMLQKAGGGRYAQRVTEQLLSVWKQGSFKDMQP